MLQFIVNSLQKLAATRDLAVVVLTQCATKMQAERGATLIPAINATVWEQGVSTRLVLFRDWAQDGDETRGLHFVETQKLNGKASTSLDLVCAFRVEEVCTLGSSFILAADMLQGGLVSVDYNNTQPSRALSATPAQKRKLGETDFEIADSEDEEYGWDDDEDIPPMPSQWQGSEDLLLVRQPESDPEDQENEDTADNEAENPTLNDVSAESPTLGRQCADQDPE